MTESGRTQAEEQLADARHHLRTPLNHIIGYSDLMLEEPGALDSEGIELLEAIRTNAHHILDQVQLCLAPGDQQEPEEKIKALRTEIGSALDLIISNAGRMAQRLHGSPLLDI